MGWITDWIKNIVFVTLFATFFELLLPSSKMKQFVRVVLGLFIMLAIINPAIELVRGGFEADDIPALGLVETNAAQVNTAAQAIVSQREKLARDIYIRDLAQQIQAIAETVDGVAKAKVRPVCDFPDNGVANLREIRVYVHTGARQKGTHINAIVIGQTERPGKAAISEQIITRIQTRLSELYQVKPGQITVMPLEE
ncbi:stage III sporulation protein AF [Acetonema longum]|uniref:Stage III sporulation protein AF n=1 Tax=Acetonema longum DSM 6540 TaxID=1009370 RepID=F7NJX5_9FIRM|nr:stage III sporulation protein AF [Acetonema longum]EGO63622.1 stage III sporulation protein AF [Acetonema longum DSM 6540]